jgi:predicted MFS family arabinose efflux permease
VSLRLLPPKDGPDRGLRSRTFASLVDNPAYRRFYFGQGVSLVGSWLQQAAVSWIVFDLTHSERWLGIVEAAGILPGLVVGLAAGAMADRVPARRMILAMQVAQMVLAACLAVLVGLDTIRIAHLVAILALARVCVTFELPSRQVLLYALVGREGLLNAIALNSGLFNLSRVLGPALAGFLLVHVGRTPCFALNALSFVAAIVALLSIPREIAERAGPTGDGRGDAAPVLGGWHYIRDDRRTGALFSLMGFVGVVGMGYAALTPAYAHRVLGVGARGFSLLLASGGLGATVGALAVASLGGVRRRERLVLGGMVLFALALIAASALPGLAGGSPARRLLVASPCLFAAGFGAIMFFSSTQTLIQTRVPDALRGRVMGMWMIVYSGAVAAGALASGELARAIGVPAVLRLAAALCLAAAAVAAASGRLRAEEPATIAGR